MNPTNTDTVTIAERAPPHGSQRSELAEQSMLAVGDVQRVSFDVRPIMRREGVQRRGTSGRKAKRAKWLREVTPSAKNGGGL
ncbi:MAG: hypothetical protein QM775_29275 [Pirellulales bacterium]